MANEKILIVDDDNLMLKSILRNLHDGYNIKTADNGRDALRMCVDEGPFDVVISDYQMPQMDGLKFLSTLKEKMPDAVRLILTGNINLEVALKAVNDSEVFRLLLKPIESSELKKAIDSAIKQHQRILAERELCAVMRVKKVLEGSLNGFIRLMETRDPYTAGHQHRVALLASCIAEKMDQSSEFVQNVFLAASIHDLGKLYVPAEFLNKPGPLSTLEFMLIKTHPQIGYEVLSQLGNGLSLPEIIHQHHEAINGSGYPQGLYGEEILLEAKIIAVADVVEAMSSHRPYRPALGMEAALAQIIKGSGSLYEPEVVQGCLDLIESGWSWKNFSPGPSIKNLLVTPNDMPSSA